MFESASGAKGCPGLPQPHARLADVAVVPLRLRLFEAFVELRSLRGRRRRAER
jgi:hypothetical protein